MKLDRVLRGGTLLDGTGSPGQPVDVGVLDGRVAAIEPWGVLPQAADELDVGGLIVCPAFLDTHSHSDLMVLRAPELSMKAAQGIGLDVLGQDGVSVAPLSEANRPQMARTIAGLDGTLERWTWTDVAGYLAAVEQARPGVHIAYLVPHGNIRLEVIGMEDRPAAAGELAAMSRLLEEGLDQGAIGLSTGLIYPPCCFAPTEELVALGRVLARHDRPIVVHLRSESDYLLDAVDEMITVGRESGCRVHLSHLKIAGRTNWHRVDALLARFDAAAAEGVRLSADQYPYTAGSTMMGAILPPWAHSGGVERTISLLSDPDSRARIRDAMLAPGPHAWDNFWSWAGGEGVFVADVASGRRPELIGRSIQEIADEAGQDHVSCALDLLRDEGLGVSMIAFSQSEEVVLRLLTHPAVNGCTDGLLLGKPHPRCYGAFPRILRRSRERGLVPLPELVRKLSSQAAEALTLRGRGVVRVGAEADLVAFDAENVADRATYQDPRQAPVGLPHVLVAGEPVLRDGAHTGARPGRVIRG